MQTYIDVIKEDIQVNNILHENRKLLDIDYFYISNIYNIYIKDKIYEFVIIL